MNIDTYLSHGGYKALEKALKEMKPAEVTEEVKKGGVRGRGRVRAALALRRAPLKFSASGADKQADEPRRGPSLFFPKISASVGVASCFSKDSADCRLPGWF